MKNKVEYGYQFDIKTGKIVGTEIRGKKGQIEFIENKRNLGSIHTHPPGDESVGAGEFPSAKDIKTYRGQAGTDHLVVSPTEIWYIHAEEELGLHQTQFFTQREIDKIFDNAYKEVTAKGQKLAKEGKLKTDDDTLRAFLNKEIGDIILREFSKPEWKSKGFTIERYYR